MRLPATSTSRASRAVALSLGATAFLCAGLAAPACGSIREGPIAGSDAGSVDGPTRDAGPPDSEKDVKPADSAADSAWRIIRDNPDAGALRAVWGASADVVFAVGDDGLALEWRGGKLLDTVLGNGANMYGVWGTGPEDVYAVGAVADEDVAVIMHQTSVGWIEITTSYPHGMRAVGGIPSEFFAGGYDGVILAGPTFTEGVKEPPNPDIALTTYAPIVYSISATSKDNVMAAADVDTTLYYDGSGWHAYADPTDRTRTYRAVFGAPDAGTDFYWGANYYGLWRFTGMENPVRQLNEERNLPQDDSLFIWSVWGFSADRVVCVGSNGRIMTYDTTSGTVHIQPSPTGKNLYGVWGTSFDDLWIVGDGQLVLRGSVTF